MWDALGKLVRFDFLLLMLIDEQTRSIRVETMAGAPPVDSPVGRNFPLEGGPSEVVWKSQKPLYVSDIEDETRFRPDVLRDMQRYQLRSGFWVPLTTVRRKLGSMVFASREVDPYGAEDREFLEHVARHVAIAVENALASGRDVLFDIDWQGTQQLKEKGRDDLVTVFILPPSTRDLERRLISRAQDSADVVARRMSKAADEMSHWAEYDYTIINKDIATSLNQLKSILTAERLKRERQLGLSDFVKALREGR